MMHSLDMMIVSVKHLIKKKHVLKSVTTDVWNKEEDEETTPDKTVVAAALLLHHLIVMTILLLRLQYSSLVMEVLEARQDDPSFQDTESFKKRTT